MRERRLAPSFLTLVLDGSEWAASRPERFISGERAAGVHHEGGWVCARAGLDAVQKRKSLTPFRESNPGLQHLT
jgi:hypothetical protein